MNELSNQLDNIILEEIKNINQKIKGTSFLESLKIALIDKINELKARTAKKPLTGEFIQLPIRRKVSFHAGKELRERVNQDMELIKETEKLIDSLPAPENVFEVTMG